MLWRTPATLRHRKGLPHIRRPFLCHVKRPTPSTWRRTWRDIRKNGLCAGGARANRWEKPVSPIRILFNSLAIHKARVRVLAQTEHGQVNAADEIVRNAKKSERYGGPARYGDVAVKCFVARSIPSAWHVRSFGRVKGAPHCRRFHSADSAAESDQSMLVRRPKPAGCGSSGLWCVSDRRGASHFARISAPHLCIQVDPREILGV